MINDASISVGKKIKEIRKSMGISGSCLAKRVGVSQQQISRYESGQTPMTIDMLIMISHVLNCPITKLLSEIISVYESDNLMDFEKNKRR
ncbi:TPA: helix-turn-helix transcriptional regulator [Morganella morganii]|uniref:Helix-turn-helix domain-containing protein n=1 Tax=bacterium 19GA11TI05 TaxID=2920688 RepID=A0AAU6TYN3_UNCXX|nr:helix-turn-helix transcriptional regulator [Morganella morganii]HCC5750035.1 helix-turn-helix transcriptional regulator [Morganella morganii]